MRRYKQRAALRDHAAETALFSRRAIVGFMFVIALVGLLLGNLYNLQVIEHKSFQTRSNDNRIRLIPVAPNRGLIYDRNGILLADNQPTFSLDVVPEQVVDMQAQLEDLQTVLLLSDEDKKHFEERLKGHRRFKPITLLNRLSEQDVAMFAVNSHRFPGFAVEAGLTRSYPHSQSLTHLLGYVARINSKDLKRIDEIDESARYAATKRIGKQGIERYYESILHGEPGMKEVEVNNRGRIVRTISGQAPVAGQDLHLTLDLPLQLKAEEMLAGRRGAVVAMDPKTGGVLAMVSSPSYDPNLFVGGISGKKYGELLNDRDRPLINRATQGQYAPASTVKPLLALLGLEKEVVTEKTKVWDPGWWQIPNVERKYRDWKKWGHGWVDLNKAITSSCDIYFYELAYNTGINNISNFMYEFGFGQNTGIDLFEESTGNLPSREWKERKYKEPWYIGDTISVGIGQGYWTTTPLQLASSTAMLANSGRRLVPHFLQATGQDGQIAQEAPPEKPPIELQRPESWQSVQRAMYLTAHRSGGSGYRLFNDAPYKSAVKTGTGQVFGVAEDAEYDEDQVSEFLRDNALFVGYAPFDDPQITIAVVLENAGWGGANAGPVARALFDEFLIAKDTP
ncbi:penicillin-binding protein 2 [Ferrimonas lipolytica]|uniref:Peptidoglycan D,D-transpeptidase MrdA n=1 Tax=Ferrimonas lipolytica TaxID=2724191 RepID=A0A6H1UEQ6_9GAMM|nr:penicillin-binding protein 2 [Ferrimonas lipolytica]QIZ77587.1 penicillin-binding protein 2 [Ferrimonas lipolytica]